MADYNFSHQLATPLICIINNRIFSFSAEIYGVFHLNGAYILANDPSFHTVPKNRGSIRQRAEYLLSRSPARSANFIIQYNLATTKEGFNNGTSHRLTPLGKMNKVLGPVVNIAKLVIVEDTEMYALKVATSDIPAGPVKAEIAKPSLNIDSPLVI